VSQGEQVPARRRRAEREAPELGAAVDRMLLALVRRGASGELEAIEELVRVRDSMPALVQAAVAAAVAGPAEYSFGEVGRWLGISRQAARQAARKSKAGR
jgi:predicted transcriptional regulator